MTPKTYTITVTAEQAEDLFDAINVASIFYDREVVQMDRVLGGYDWRISSVDKRDMLARRRDLFSKRWVEFYQKVKPIRAAEKADRELMEGGAA